MKTQLDILLNDGIIAPSVSPHNDPLLLVRKKDMSEI